MTEPLVVVELFKLKVVIDEGLNGRLNMIDLIKYLHDHVLVDNHDAFWKDGQISSRLRVTINTVDWMELPGMDFLLWTGDEITFACTPE